MIAVIVHEKLLFQENEGVLMLSVLLMLEDMHFVCQSDRCAWNSSELVSFSCLSHITSSFVSGFCHRVSCTRQDKNEDHPAFPVFDRNDRVHNILWPRLFWVFWAWAVGCGKDGGICVDTPQTAPN